MSFSVRLVGNDAKAIQQILQSRVKQQWGESLV